MTRLLPDQLYVDDVPDGYRTDVPLQLRKKNRQPRASSDIEAQQNFVRRKNKKRVVQLSKIKSVPDSGGHFNNLNKLKDPKEKNLVLDNFIAAAQDVNSTAIWSQDSAQKSAEYFADSGRESGSPPRQNCFTDGEETELKNFGFILGPGFSRQKKKKRLPSAKPLKGSKSSSDLRAPSSIGSVSKWAEILQNNQIIFCGASRADAGPLVNHQPRRPVRAATDIDLEPIPSRPPAKPPRLRHAQSVVALNTHDDINSKKVDLTQLKFSPLKLASSMDGVEIKTLAYFGRPMAPPLRNDLKPPDKVYCLQEKNFIGRKRRTRPDASSQNEAVHLQQQLRSISSGLVNLQKDLPLATPEDVSAVPPPPPILDTTPATCTYENIGDIKPLAPSIRVDGTKDLNQSPPRTLVDVNDLIHLNGPLTEDSVLRTLHARFFHRQYFTRVGPVLLAANPYQEPRNDLTLTSVGSANYPELMRVVREAARQQGETGYPQAIILSGESGSGKTYASMVLLRQLFDIAGGGPETDSFKHLAAAFTVLRSFGTAKTLSNSQSSRIGHFIEVQATDGVLYRTKIHCYLLDQSRVVKQAKYEKNYHIFYQMLAGLSHDERAKLHLEEYSVKSFSYLNQADTQCDTQLDAERFRNWKSGVALLGIPSVDVLRTLAAILLLGNIKFVENDGKVDIESGRELGKVASLLGITSTSLYTALTRRTKKVCGQPMQTLSTSSAASAARDALAKALYCRTVATVVRRANSLKGMGSTTGTLSSDSTESVHHHVEGGSQHTSTGGSGGAKNHKSMSALNSAVKHATDGFIGILDMFGFENAQENRLEHLCINLCAETMQHFYNTHVFKSSLEACKDEGVNCDVQIEYSDNVPCIDLISSLRTGLLSMCDVECSIRGTAETFVRNVSGQHRNNGTFLRPAGAPSSSFAVRHFAGCATYDASCFLECNRDVIPDDVLCLFHKSSCSFPFGAHLFNTEVKALLAQSNTPKGANFRISPTANFDQNADEPISTLTQDFHTRLDNLLRTLVHAKPQFVRCIRTNTQELAGHFDRHAVMQQLRALQVLETVNLMSSGYAHRMRFRAFNNRYRLLAPFRSLKRTEEKAVLDCQLILEYFTEALKNIKLSNAAVNWSLGKRHIFLSENARQLLERLREQRRQTAARLIQGAFRHYARRKRRGPCRKPARPESARPGGSSASVPAAGWPGGSLPRGGALSVAGPRAVNLNLSTQSCFTQPPTQQRPIASARTATLTKTGTLTKLHGRPRPQPIAGTPPPENERCDQRLIQQTCALFGLDLERPPPVPPSRTYTVTGNAKLGYPQARVMKMSFTDGSDVKLFKGDTVMVMASSQKRGHLVVECRGQTYHVPYQFLELKPKILLPPAVNSLINTTLMSN